MDQQAYNRKRPKRRWVAVGGSAAAHLVMLGLLVFGVREVATPPEDHPIEVELVQPVLRSAPRPPKPASPVARAEAPKVAPRQARLAPPPSIAASPFAPSGATTPTAGAAPHAAPLPGLAGGLRSALRGSVGCDAEDVVKLSEEERRRCDHYIAQMAKSGKPLPSSLGLDAGKQQVLDRDAADNEAWRRYHKSYSSTDYPGLRSALRK